MRRARLTGPATASDPVSAIVKATETSTRFSQLRLRVRPPIGCAITPLGKPWYSHRFPANRARLGATSLLNCRDGRLSPGIGKHMATREDLFPIPPFTAAVPPGALYRARKLLLRH